MTHVDPDALRRLGDGTAVALRPEADVPDAVLVRPPMTPAGREHLAATLAEHAAAARAMFSGKVTDADE